MSKKTEFLLQIQFVISSKFKIVGRLSLKIIEKHHFALGINPPQQEPAMAYPPQQQPAMGYPPQQEQPAMGYPPQQQYPQPGEKINKLKFPKQNYAFQ